MGILIDKCNQKNRSIERLSCANNVNYFSNSGFEYIFQITSGVHKVINGIHFHSLLNTFHCISSHLNTQIVQANLQISHSYTSSELCHRSHVNC